MDTTILDPKTVKIAQLNDALRRTFVGGKVVMTASVSLLGQELREKIFREVHNPLFKFNDDGDPNGEHNFGAFTVQGERYFWKIDYYDLTMEWGSEDPSDPAQTTRVLTIMRADEY